MENTMLKSNLRFVPAALIAAALAMGQTPAPNKTLITGTGSFTSFVEDMDRSLAFYHDAFGMDVPTLPASGQRPYNQPNPGLFKFFDIDGAKERHQSARIPNAPVTVEFMEIQQVPHQTIPLRIQDPGNATLVLIVRDVDAALARATQAKATIVTPGGKPVTLANSAEAVLIKDIDGRFIELLQLPSPLNGNSDIGGMRLMITVNDIGQTLKAYRDVLGFKVDGETKFAPDAPMRALTGLSKAEVRSAIVQAPGSQLSIQFVEFQGVDRKPL
jgi:catechol 2,3-dioxygenase-like lactoylglutathione lyase family enzyme